MTGQFGYAGKILRVDLSSGSISQIPTVDYVDRFLGGRGLGAKIYWDEVAPEIRPFDPENRLIFTTGPLAGFSGLAGSRWQVCGKSPTTDPEQFSYCNLGGHWGVNLKFAGYDGIIVQGRSNKPVYIVIEDEKAAIKDASKLWLKGAARTRDMLKQELGNSMRIVATGPAGDNMVNLATMLADNDASGSCGFGAVMGSKRLKAIAVRGSIRPTAAEPERLRELAEYVHKIAKRTPATMAALEGAGARMKPDYCWGCIPERGCQRRSYTAESGEKGKFMCHSGVFYQVRAARFYGGLNEVPFHATRLCDDLGVDTQAIECMTMWLLRCMRAGILTDENTGIPISKVGSGEFMETLLNKVAFREGFGDVLAHGIKKAAEIVGQGSKDHITDYMHKAGQGPFYGPREYITTGLLYALEPRQPIQQLHDICVPVMGWVGWINKTEKAYVTTDVLKAVARKFWGDEITADFSTYEGKALAAKKVQDRAYAKESLILCDFSWPIQTVEFSEDHVGDPTIESKLLSAITGNKVDEEGLYRIGARIFNLQRAILAREGHQGRKHDTLPDYEHNTPLKTGFGNPECMVPGKDGQPFSRKGQVVEKDKWEQLKGEYYQLRGWDVATGLQTQASLEELDLHDVADGLAKRGLLV